MNVLFVLHSWKRSHVKQMQYDRYTFPTPCLPNDYCNLLNKDCLVMVLSFETKKNLGTIAFSVFDLPPMLGTVYTALFKFILVEKLYLEQRAADNGEEQVFEDKRSREDRSGRIICWFWGRMLI